MSHECPECQRVHQSEAEERAERERNVRLMRSLNRALLWGIERADSRYGKQLADFLTGCAAMVALFPDTDWEPPDTPSADAPENGRQPAPEAPSAVPGPEAATTATGPDSGGAR